MAASDATPIPIKNQAYRVTFPILDDDGDLVTAAGSLDSEISKDQGTFADCTNEATEIATGSGMYYLDLTATEMNADTVALKIKSTAGKTTPIVLYPQTNGADFDVNVTYWNGTAIATPDTAGYPKVTIKDGTGTGEIALTAGAIDNVTLTATTTDVTNDVTADVTKWSGTTVATPDTVGYPKVTVKDGTGVGEIALTAGAIDNVTLTATTTSVTNEVTADVTKWNGTAVTTPDTAGSPKVTITSGSGAGELLVSSGIIRSDLLAIAGSPTAANNADAFFTDGWAGGATRLKVDVDEIKADATAATNLSKSALAIIYGAAATGTLSTTTCTTDLTGYLADELNGRAIVFYGAAGNAGCAATITDYAVTNGQVTFSGGIATAPVDGDTFVIV